MANLRILPLVFLFGGTFVFILFPDFAQAQPPPTPTQLFSLSGIIGIFDNLGNWIFFIGLLIAPIMIIIGAALFLTAGGDPNRMAIAKKVFLWAGIGLGLVLLAKGVFTVLRSILGT